MALSVIFGDHSGAIPALDWDINGFDADGEMLFISTAVAGWNLSAIGLSVYQSLLFEALFCRCIFVSISI